jgi:carboxyl-terminal processing protease
MKFWKRRYIAIIAIVLVAVTSVGYTHSDVFFQIKKSLTIFGDVFREVSLNYVDKIDPQKLMGTAVDAVLQTLDPYTVFIDESDTQEINIITKGKYAGVGLEVGARGGNLVVIAPLDGYPAYRKGVKAGDIILSVNGQSIEDLSPEELQNQLRGEAGTNLSLTIKRYGVDQPLTFDLIREEIILHNVKYYGFIDDSKTIGYILISHFSENTANEVKEAIKNLQKQSMLDGLILDLRNNPGGLLSEAVKTVDQFVKPGLEIVSIKGREAESNTPYYSSETPLYGSRPLVVLQNNGSASASEIVAGALQDLDRGVIIGDNSFGKGLVQVIKPLSYNTALKITTAKYYTPSGRCIQAVNYNHNENIGNGASRIPDSLRKAFKTRNGRTVFDGTGIEPDVYIKERKEKLLEIALQQHSLYFFYANEYVAKHKDFNIKQNSDSLYASFRKFIKEKQFSLHTPAGQMIAHLREQLQDPAIAEKAKTNLNNLEQLVAVRNNEEMKREAPEIKKQLYLELVSRYKGTKGKIEAELQFDTYIQKAVQVLKNRPEYNKILAVKN